MTYNEYPSDIRKALKELELSNSLDYTGEHTTDYYTNLTDKIDNRGRVYTNKSRYGTQSKNISNYHGDCYETSTEQPSEQA